MPIISVKDNVNNTWKGNAKNKNKNKTKPNKKRKEQAGGGHKQ